MSVHPSLFVGGTGRRMSRRCLVVPGGRPDPVLAAVAPGPLRSTTVVAGR